MMNIRSILFLAVALLFVVSNLKGEEKSDSLMALTCRLHKIDADYFLDFTLRVKKDIAIYKASLPWISNIDLRLAAILDSPVMEDLEYSRFIMDPASGTIELEEGKEYTGSLKLNLYFEELPNALKRKSVIVFWCYTLKGLDGKRLDDSGAWVKLDAISK